jgi:hypothetical protein
MKAKKETKRVVAVKSVKEGKQARSIVQTGVRAGNDVQDRLRSVVG